MSQYLELTRFTVKPESIDEFLARRPAMLDAFHERYPGFRHDYLARLDGDVWVGVLIWDDIEQCQRAMDEAPGIPQVAAWLELIDEVRSMEQAELMEPVGTAGRR